LGGAGNVTRYGNMIIYGLTDEPITSLVPLARSWNRPPAITNVKGCTSDGYSKEQRAYQLTADTSKLSFTLEASENSPVVNPCFVIKNWHTGTTKAGMQIKGRSVPMGKDFRQGIIRDTDGTPTMVIWVKTESTEPLDITIIRLGHS
jgi:hypothetical protein